MPARDGRRRRGGGGGRGGKRRTQRRRLAHEPYGAVHPPAGHDELLMIGILVFGIVSYRKLPVSDLPTVDYPTINVEREPAGRESGDDGRHGRDAAREVVLRRSPASTRSRRAAALGSTNITLQFSLDRDIEAAAQDVNAAIGKTLPFLPSTILPPNYRKQNPSASPILIFALTSNVLPMTQVDEFARDDDRAAAVDDRGRRAGQRVRLGEVRRARAARSRAARGAQHRRVAGRERDPATTTSCCPPACCTERTGR